MMALEQMAERLAELKSMDVPRASLARVDTVDSRDSDQGPWAAMLPKQLHPILDEYLRHFAWHVARDRPGYKDGTMLCPGCDGLGWFQWGVRHGSGMCQCGWPGTLYHLVLDPRDEAECERCGFAKLDHVQQSTDVVKTGASGWLPPITRHELRCPEARALTDVFKAPHAIKFDFLLWAHPYEVHLPKGDA